MSVEQIDMDLLQGEYAAMCYNNTLHIGATYQDLGSNPLEYCYNAGKSFQIYKSLQIVYHYHNNPYQSGKGVLLKVSGKIFRNSLSNAGKKFGFKKMKQKVMTKDTQTYFSVL